ncbi:MAG: MFS transporter [Chloroflexota bacterium]
MRRGTATVPVVLVILATLFGTMEMTVVVTALPTIGRTFPWAVDWLPWLTTASLMAAAVAMPIGGKMADEWGPRKAFLLGMGVFTVGSLLGGLVGWVLPRSMGLLLGLRALQGFGGGTFAPVGLKLISSQLKGRQRTQTIGMAGMVSPVAAVAGPNLGGLLASYYPWQLIFLLNAALGLAIFLLTVGFWREPGQARVGGGPKTILDAAGVVVFSGLVVTVMVALTLSRQAGFASPPVVALLVAGATLGLALPMIENRSATPFLESGLLRTQGMGVVLSLSFLQGLTMYSTLLFLSVYVQTHPAIQASPAQTGALITPAALAQAIVAPLVGRTLPKVGYRVMVVAGMSLTSLALLGLGAGPTSLALLGLLLLVSRVGATMTGVPLAAAGLEAHVSKAGAISGLRQLSNVMGGVVGPVALGAAFPLVAREGAHPLAFVAIGLLLLATLPFGLKMPVRELDAGGAPGRRASADQR